MFPLYIVALLIHATYSTPCEDGVTIVSKETKNPGDLIGNWTYVYQWDTLHKLVLQIPNNMVDDIMLKCPRISIEAFSLDYVKAKEVECKNSVVPFNWADAKLKLNFPLEMKDTILVMGEKETWLVMGCSMMVPVVVRKVSEDYIVMKTQAVTHATQMYARRIPTKEELNCIVHNVDVVKDMSEIGYGLCY